MPVGMQCACRCGVRTTSTQREFLPGHALRHMYRLRSRALAGQQAAWDELYRRGWTVKAKPGTLSFGFEAEFYGIERHEAVEHVRGAGVDCHDDGYHHHTKDYWRITEDGSVTAEANELVSPVLKLTKPDLDSTKTVLRALSRAGAQVDRSCGLHVHHNASHLNIMQLAQTVAHWVLFQPITNTMLPPSRHDGGYCRGMYDPQHWYDQVLGQGNMDRIRRDAYNFGRYHSLNIGALQAHNTLEFRQHNGTLNGDKVIHWSRYTRSFLQAGRAGDWQDLVSIFGSPQAVGESMGLTNALDYLGLPADTRRFLLARADSLNNRTDSTPDAEDLASDTEDDEYPGYDPESDDGEWCSSCQEYHYEEHEDEDY